MYKKDGFWFWVLWAYLSFGVIAFIITGQVAEVAAKNTPLLAIISEELFTK